MRSKVKTKKTAKNKIQHGNVELSADDFKNAKWRVTMLIDEGIVDSFRAEAARLGTKYQTLMNEKLRESTKTFGGPSLVERIEKLESTISELKKTG